MKTQNSPKISGRLRKCLLPLLVLAMVWGILMFPSTAFADGMKCPTCGARLNTGATLHTDHKDSASWSGWEELNDTYHYNLCMTCAYAGHNSGCAEIYSLKEEHSFRTDAGGKTETCSVCGYQKDIVVVCEHKNTYWKANGTDCVERCKDCDEVLQTTKHSYGTEGVETSTDPDRYHDLYCVRCGYENSFSHNFVTVCYVSKATSSYVTNSRNRAGSHKYKSYCTVCGHKGNVMIASEPHTFVKNKCTVCGYKKVIGPKTTIKSLTSKLTKTAKVKTKATWTWYINHWTYTPAGTYKLYYYKCSLKWKKSKGAAAYVVSTNKLVAGDVYEQNAVIYKTASKSKTSMTYSFTSRTKLKYVTLYLAQVNKDGIIGKVTKKKVKVK